jgi:hypothetical protein
MVDDVAAIGNWNCHNLQIKKIVFPNRLKDRSFSVDNPMRLSEELAEGSSLLVEQKLV